MQRRPRLGHRPLVGIIGPWSNGVGQVVLDAGFNAERWYRFIEQQRVTVWYSSPTAIRQLMREGTPLVRRHDLASLRHLASVGEPLNPEAVLWSQEAFGRPFHDTFWQTETGCIVIANRPELPIKPGSMGLPFPGITNRTWYCGAWTRYGFHEDGLLSAVNVARQMGIPIPWTA